MEKDEWNKLLTDKTVDEVYHYIFNKENEHSPKSLGFFHILTKMSEELSITDIFNILGIQVFQQTRLPLQSVKCNILLDMNERIKLNVTRQDLTSVGYDIDMLKSILSAVKFDDFIKSLKDNSWELYTTVEYILNHAVQGLTFDALPEYIGFGPDKVDVRQLSKYKTGIYCFILNQFKIIENPECFIGFDS